MKVSFLLFLSDDWKDFELDKFKLNKDFGGFDCILFFLVLIIY